MSQPIDLGILPADPARRALVLEAVEAASRYQAAMEEAKHQRAIYRTAVRRAAIQGVSLSQLAKALRVSPARMHQVVHSGAVAASDTPFTVPPAEAE